jgi:hypothetical protein
LTDDNGDVACTIVQAPTLRITSSPRGHVNDDDGAIGLEFGDRHVAGLHTLLGRCGASASSLTSIMRIRCHGHRGMHMYQGTVRIVGVNIYPKENDLSSHLPLLIFVSWGVWMRGKCGCE